MFFFMFLPGMNPARVCGLISKNLSLFTSAVSYSSLISGVGRGFRSGWIDESVFIILFVSSIFTVLGIVAIAAGACISLGNIKCKSLSFIFSFAGTFSLVGGLVGIYISYSLMGGAARVEKVNPEFPNGLIVFFVLGGIVLIATIAAFIIVPKVSLKRIKKVQKTESDETGEAEVNKEESEILPYEMESKYKLFLMFLPFALLAFVFCYLPLWGWRYGFFDYKAGDELTMDNFVGFKWFTYLFQNAATKRDIVRVLRNTLAMSGLGIATSWIPLAFAVFLSEINSKKFKRVVQTFTTIPNFISWILVYTVALAIFSTDGFLNTLLTNLGTPSNTNYLMSSEHSWLKMLAWGIWKGVGWSAIIYIAGISGIDKQLYEAATVDGAGRFQRIWHVTIPGLIPTYMVMLLMSVAGMLSNGLDQYLVFSNSNNADAMEVLDLYVYNLGFAGGSIPLSTVIGMAKSIVSVALLFMANSVSKLVRHESIV
ncbi:MAG: ABC transporter permease subunit [Eubacterium sp.]|nr:ABC transporter permease subunit [Eubacterium sp.]